MESAVETTRDWSSCVSLSVPIRCELSWRTGEHPGEVQLLVGGELCVWTLSCLEPALWGLVCDLRPTTVTMDLAGVTFVDARGVSLLSRLAAHVGSWDGALVLTRPSHVVARLLSLVGIDRELQVVHRVDSLDGHGAEPRTARRESGSVSTR